MWLRQGRLQGFRMEPEITPAIPGPQDCAEGPVASSREAKPTCQGLLSWLLPKREEMGTFPPILGGTWDIGELPAQQG